MPPAPDSHTDLDATLPADDATVAESTTSSSNPDLLFDRYRKVRELGRGGMGMVLLATDEELGIPVAVKVVPDQVVYDTDGIMDLKREVRSGMLLTHPGI